MAMSLGGGTRQRAEMNVTPLIDVLLVLIIIFMVVLPQHSAGLDTKVPQQSDAPDTPAPPGNDLVITVQADGLVRLNQEAPLALASLGQKLRSLFAGSAGQVIFVRAEKGLEYQQVAEVIDIAKGAGLDRIALMTQ